MSRHLTILLIWVYMNFPSRYLCQWRTSISRSSWRSVHGSMHHDIHVFTVRTKCSLSLSFESFNLSCGYWYLRPCVPFPILFSYLWVAFALGILFPLYFWMAFVIFLLGWDVAAINEQRGHYIHLYQYLCCLPSSGTPPLYFQLKRLLLTLCQTGVPFPLYSKLDSIPISGRLLALVLLV